MRGGSGLIPGRASLSRTNQLWHGSADIDPGDLLLEALAQQRPVDHEGLFGAGFEGDKKVRLLRLYIVPAISAMSQAFSVAAAAGEAMEREQKRERATLSVSPSKRAVSRSSVARSTSVAVLCAIPAAEHCPYKLCIARRQGDAPQAPPDAFEVGGEESAPHRIEPERRLAQRL